MSKGPSRSGEIGELVIGGQDSARLIEDLDLRRERNPVSHVEQDHSFVGNVVHRGLIGEGETYEVCLVGVVADHVPAAGKHVVVPLGREVDVRSAVGRMAFATPSDGVDRPSAVALPYGPEDGLSRVAIPGGEGNGMQLAVGKLPATAKPDCGWVGALAASGTHFDHPSARSLRATPLQLARLGHEVVQDGLLRFGQCYPFLNFDLRMLSPVACPIRRLDRASAGLAVIWLSGMR